MLYSPWCDHCPDVLASQRLLSRSAGKRVTTDVEANVESSPHELRGNLLRL